MSYSHLVSRHLIHLTFGPHQKALDIYLCLVLPKMSIRHWSMPKGLWLFDLPKTILHGPNVYMDVLNRTKFQGPFSVDQNCSVVVLYRTKCPVSLQTIGYLPLSMGMNDHLGSSLLRIHTGSRNKVREQKTPFASFIFYFGKSVYIHYSCNN